MKLTVLLESRPNPRKVILGVQSDLLEAYPGLKTKLSYVKSDDDGHPIRGCYITSPVEGIFLLQVWASDMAHEPPYDKGVTVVYGEQTREVWACNSTTGGSRSSAGVNKGSLLKSSEIVQDVFELLIDELGSQANIQYAIDKDLGSVLKTFVIPDKVKLADVIEVVVAKADVTDGIDQFTTDLEKRYNGTIYGEKQFRVADEERIAYLMVKGA